MHISGWHTALTGTFLPFSRSVMMLTHDDEAFPAETSRRKENARLFPAEMGHLPVDDGAFPVATSHRQAMKPRRHRKSCTGRKTPAHFQCIWRIDGR